MKKSNSHGSLSTMNDNATKIVSSISALDLFAIERPLHMLSTLQMEDARPKPSRLDTMKFVKFEMTQASIQNIAECLNTNDDDMACCLANPGDPSVVEVTGGRIKSNLEEARTQMLFRRRRRHSQK